MQGPVGVLVVWCVLFLKFPEPLRLQGACGNFLVLRIKVCKTIRVRHALWGPALWERGPEKGAFVLLVGFSYLVKTSDV